MNKKLLISSFFIFLFLLIEGSMGLAKGIGKHEAWRVVFASVGLVVSLCFIIVLAKRIFRKEVNL